MRASLFLVIVTAVGCGGPGATSDPPPPAEKAFEEIAETYKYLAAQNIRPPKKLEDLQEYDASLTTAWPKLQTGEIVVNWGAGYSASSADVLAYEKGVPTAGGRVVLRNGTVKTVAAGELKVK